MNNVLKAVKILLIDPGIRAQGLDLSHWELSFDPAKASQRIDFAIMKVTEGATWVDPLITGIWSGVRQVYIRGAYHYQRSGVSWLAQADHFLRVALMYDFHFYALDVEQINNVYSDTFFADVRRIIDHWRSRSGKKVVLYTNWNTYKLLYASILRLYPDGLEWLDGLDFWYAWPSSLFNEPILPAQRKTWQIWQKSWVGTGAEWGTGAYVDVNVFNGTPADMARWVGLLEPQPEPEPPPAPIPIEPEPLPETWDATVIAGNKMVIRKYPVIIDGTKTGFYATGGEKFSGRLWVGNSYVWMRIEKSPRAELLGKWVAVRTDNGAAKFITLTRPEASSDQPSGLPQLWRVKHDPLPLERPNLPEVHSMFPNHFVRFGRELQLLERRLNSKLNNRKWRAVHTYRRAFNNQNGYDKPGDPRVDYINGRDLGAPVPKQEVLVCGGALLAGYVEGSNLVVHTLDTSGPVPGLEDLKPWEYFDAVSIDTDGTGKIGIVRRFPQGEGERVYILLLADRTRYPKVTIQLSKLEKLDMTKPLPDPYRYP